jgi:hypothetical protein
LPPTRGGDIIASGWMSTGQRMPRALQVLTLAAALAVFAGAGARTASAQSSAPASDKTLQEVTVTAARLRQRISKFVNQIATLENAEGIPRWNEPVCPQESGLPREEGEWVLSRFVEVARAAGVPMGSPHCRPNLYIVASSDPEVLLRRTKANNANRIAMFGDATPYVINQFIETPRSVRVWYGSNTRGASGEIVSAGVLGGLEPTDKPSVNVLQGPSRLRANVVWSFSLVVEVADQTRLQGLTLGQFADYMAMVGLAEIKPGAHLGDAPSILKLFDGSPRAAPPGLTDWDRAFLKSLYATDQVSKLQKGQIGNAMVRELVH